ncbi:hypothetical protein ScPMuIL_004468 [Solemya velum]
MILMSKVLCLVLMGTVIVSTPDELPKYVHPQQHSLYSHFLRALNEFHPLAGDTRREKSGYGRQKCVNWDPMNDIDL